MQLRRSARLVILSPQNRLLLFQYSDEHSAPFWSTPGGELINDESYRDAAKRELIEETGFVADIRSMIRERDSVYAVARSTPARWLEKYFVVNVNSEKMPNSSNWTDEERATITKSRWWAMEDWLTNKETLKPEWIPELHDSAINNADVG
ncbi:MAG: NUDIX domain-containing protein [Ilumatobacteraceae bacterium]|nr:NUDIX domain-containing protein [Ilumatobacteraceae bacterium]